MTQNKKENILKRLILGSNIYITIMIYSLLIQLNIYICIFEYFNKCNKNLKIINIIS